MMTMTKRSPGGQKMTKQSEAKIQEDKADIHCYGNQGPVVSALAGPVGIGGGKREKARTWKSDRDKHS
jgi:hypothetical protein